MRRLRRVFSSWSFRLAVVVLVVMLAVPWVALADDISNTLDNTVDTEAEVMPLSVGDASGTTKLYVITRNNDGKQGCNLTGKTTLVVSVNSSDPSVATVSPSSITFGSCGDTPTLTVTPRREGSTTISLTQTSNDTGASFNLDPATFIVNVTAPPPANTPPQVSITGVKGGASYEIGSVPTAICNVTDAEDGNSSFPATLSAITGTLSEYGLGQQTASCSYTDTGGLTASASVTYGIVDTTPPVITLVSRTAPNVNGWNNSDVTLTWSCTDSGSGVVNDSVSQTVSTEGENQSATGTCKDHAGNEVSDTQTGINIDKTAPSVSLVGGPADGGTYYFGFVPAAPTCSASDALSGIDGACSVSGYGTAVGSHTVTATAKDKAGNSASASATYSVLAWTLKGFYQPVDMNGVYNTVKNGSTVPLKFEIFAGPTELTDAAYVKSLTYAQTACDASAITDEIETTTTGGTSLRYDAVAGQFVYNWKTPSTAGKCYRVTMTTQDGSSLVAFFKLK